MPNTPLTILTKEIRQFNALRLPKQRGRGVFRDTSLSSDNIEERLRGIVREGSEVGTLTYQVGQECDSSARWSAMR